MAKNKETSETKTNISNNVETIVFNIYVYNENNLLGYYSMNDNELYVYETINGERKYLGHITNMIKLPQFYLNNIIPNRDNEERINKVMERVKYVYYNTNASYIKYSYDELFDDDLILSKNHIKQTTYSTLLSEYAININSVEFIHLGYTNKFITIFHNNNIIGSIRVCRNKFKTDDKTIAYSIIDLFIKQEGVDTTDIKNIID